MVEGAYVEPGHEPAERVRLAGDVCKDREVTFTPAVHEDVTGDG